MDRIEKIEIFVKYDHDIMLILKEIKQEIRIWDLMKCKLLEQHHFISVESKIDKIKNMIREKDQTFNHILIFLFSLYIDYQLSFIVILYIYLNHKFMNEIMKI
jgi:hypothetical protein